MQDTAGRWWDAIIDLPSSPPLDSPWTKVSAPRLKTKTAPQKKVYSSFDFRKHATESAMSLKSGSSFSGLDDLSRSTLPKVNRSPSPTRFPLRAERWSQQPPGTPSLVRRVLRDLTYSTSKRSAIGEVDSVATNSCCPKLLLRRYLLLITYHTNTAVSSICWHYHSGLLSVIRSWTTCSEAK